MTCRPPLHPPPQIQMRDYTHFPFFCWPTLGVFSGRNQLVKFGGEVCSAIFQIVCHRRPIPRPSARPPDFSIEKRILSIVDLLPSPADRLTAGARGPSEGAWEKV